jgi:hypothetical protein
MAIVAMGALAGCSDDLLDPDGEGGRAALNSGDTYVALRIKLPTSSSNSSRYYADVYDDGEACEYAVHDATVLFFASVPQVDKFLLSDVEDYYQYWENYEVVGDSVYRYYDMPYYAYVGQSPFISLEWTKDASSSITTEGVGVVKCNFAPDPDKKYYALVMLNRNHVLDALNESRGGQTIPYDFCIDNYPVNYGNSAYMMTGINYNEIADKISAGTLSPDATTYSGADGSDCDMYYPTRGGIFMTNALRYINGQYTTLVEVKAEQFADTEAVAMQNIGDPIYVERGAAKITIKSDGAESSALWNSSTGYTIADSPYTLYNGDNVYFLAWNAVNSNAYSYIIHTCIGSSDYLFSTTDILLSDKLSDDAYSYFLGADNRLQWSYSPCYTGARTTSPSSWVYVFLTGINDGRTESATAVDRETIGTDGRKVYFPKDKPKYVLETTTSYGCMLPQYSTMVVVKAQYTPKGMNRGQTFYSCADNNIYLANSTDQTGGYSYNTIEERIRECLPESSFQYVQSEEEIDDGDGEEEEEGEEYVRRRRSRRNSVQYTYGTATIDRDVITIDVSKIKDGQILASAFGGIDSSYGEYVDAIAEALADIVNAKLRYISKYENGICYYYTCIRHFPDDVSDGMKWAGEQQYYENLETEYGVEEYIWIDPGYTSDNLGRWGVVRNNWYDVEITNVTALGSPDPSFPDEWSITAANDISYGYVNASVTLNGFRSYRLVTAEY